jgi:hypothetical protein
MSAFRIDELSGVDRPACAGCRAVLMKSADGEDEGPDSAIEKMIARGAEIQKAAGRESVERAEPGDRILWAETAKAHAEEFQQLAKTRAKERGISNFTALHQVLSENPVAYRRMRLG